VISHRDGHSEENGDSGEKNRIQAIGTALTCLLRMTLAALGFAASDEDDGQAVGTSTLISRQQARELLDLIEEIGADKNALQFFQIKGVTELPGARSRQALPLLNSGSIN